MLALKEIINPELAALADEDFLLWFEDQGHVVEELAALYFVAAGPSYTREQKRRVSDARHQLTTLLSNFSLDKGILDDYDTRKAGN